jgi:hypothetical protein
MLPINSNRDKIEISTKIVQILERTLAIDLKRHGKYHKETY